MERCSYHWLIKFYMNEVGFKELRQVWVTWLGIWFYMNEVGFKDIINMVNNFYIKTVLYERSGI